MSLDSKTEAAVLETAQNLFAAYGRFDIQAAMEQFAANCQVVRFGGQFRRVGREQIEQQLELDFYFYRQMKSCMWEASWYSATAFGPGVLLLMELTATFQSERESVHIPLHFSASMILEEKHWRIVHLHVSPCGRTGSMRGQIAQLLRKKTDEAKPDVDASSVSEPPADWEDWFEKKSVRSKSDAAPAPLHSSPVGAPKSGSNPTSWEDWFEKTTFG